MLMYNNNLDIYQLQNLHFENILRSYYQASMMNQLYSLYNYTNMLMIQNNRQISFVKGEDQIYQNNTNIFKENIEQITEIKKKEETVTDNSIKNCLLSTGNLENIGKRKKNKFETVVYPFHTMKSREKDKKKLRLKVNKIISRVHNTDCLLKKIKAKYLKYLFLVIRENIPDLSTKKFNQFAEVRNLNVHHNRNNFLNLTILELLKKNNLLGSKDIKLIDSLKNEKLLNLLNKKVKYHFQFDFLYSDYYKQWVKDPIKIYQSLRGEGKLKKSINNKNCLKYPKHSKNIFKKNVENYQIYIRLLIVASCNFIFYFQNNPLKFGKKCLKKVHI